MKGNLTTIRRNHWLTVICAVLCIFIASQVILSLAAIPTYYQRVVTQTIPPKSAFAAFSYTTNESFAASAQWRGMSLQNYAVYNIAITLVPSMVSIGIAILIIIRANRNWFLWFTALLLLFYPTGYLERFPQVAEFVPNYIASGGLLWPSLALWLFLFPNGRAVPRWTRWLILPLALVHFIIQAVFLMAQLQAPIDGLFEALEPFQIVIVLEILLALVCQIYRYARVSTPMERQQTKWFLVGCLLWILPSIVLDFMPSLTSPSGDSGVVGDIVNELVWAFVPLTIGISILRYRLFDIDVIIRRTLVYSALSATLTVVYFGLVAILQNTLRALTGQESQLAILASTLAIAALFLPLRSRIQIFIDRRFYRSKYNAEQTLAHFNQAMSDAVAMDDITTQLFDAVDSTMQPERIALWTTGDR